mmetsp:Transcript_3915/g.12522  ORF Transcript_3915/g.12522 Transcript_3915/m.12522 type:complete len:225 (+) Transcript_3915:193-867(+)
MTLCMCSNRLSVSAPRPECIHMTYMSLTWTLPRARSRGVVENQRLNARRPLIAAELSYQPLMDDAGRDSAVSPPRRRRNGRHARSGRPKRRAPSPPTRARGGAACRPAARAPRAAARPPPRRPTPSRAPPPSSPASAPGRTPPGGSGLAAGATQTRGPLQPRLRPRLPRPPRPRRPPLQTLQPPEQQRGPRRDRGGPDRSARRRRGGPAARGSLRWASPRASLQ